MYIYLSSLVRTKNSSRPWENRDIRNMTIKEIVDNYSNVYFTFEHAILPGFHYCFLNDLLTRTIDVNATLVQALNSIGNLPLPTHSTQRQLISKSATFADVLQTGWSFKTMRPGAGPDDPALGSQKTDLYLYKDGIGSQQAGESLVCFVNGMAHYTYAGHNGLIALGAGKTLRNTESNLVNFLNLGILGPISYINLTGDSLEPGVGSMINETMDGYLSLGIDLTGKSVIISIGGLLYLEGDVINVINREAGYIKLNYHRIDHGSLFYEIANHLNPDNLGTILDNIRAGILLKSTIYDSDNLKEILNMDQTFAIIVDAPNVVCEYKSIQNGHLKNVLVSYELPNKPIRGFTNRLLPYRIKDEKGKFAVHVDDYRVPAFMHWTTTQFAYGDYIAYGVMRSTQDLENACVVMDIKTQSLETPS